MSIIASVIIPCRNEIAFIEACLISIIKNDFPKNKLEVLVVDGMSTDGTRSILEQYSTRFPFIKFLDNRFGYTPHALNIAIKSANGKYIIRMDAHSIYASNYVSRCVRFLDGTSIEVVGGPIDTSTHNDKLVSNTIKHITSNKFGVGNSGFRTLAKSCFVDTVPFGAYRMEIFRRIGLFNEKLIRNQDNEFSNRVLKNGGKIYMSNKLKAKYFNQESISGFFKQALKAGYWNVLTLNLDPSTFRYRYFVPLFFTIFLINLFLISLVIKSPYPFLLFMPYVILDLMISIQLVLRQRNVKLLLTLPFGFFLYHFIYGLGSCIGIFVIYVLRLNKESQRAAS